MADSTLAILVLKMTVLLVAGATVAGALRRAPAGTRHLVWLATLAGLLALPAALRYAPLRLEILPSALRTMEEAPTLPTARAARHPGLQREVSSPLEAVVARAPVPAETRSSPLPALTIRRGLFLVWAAGTLLLLGYFAIGVVAARRIIRNARPMAGPRWGRLLAEGADRLGLDRLPALVASDRVGVPFAFGAWSATVVLPEDAAGWSEERSTLVLSHELAHLKRRDLLGHALGRAVCALYWFHPLVWVAARRLRAESERACDDLVLRNGARASDYADHLLDILTSVRRENVPGAAVAMARRKEFEGRVLAILDPRLRRGTPGPAHSAALLAGLGAVFVTVAVTAPSRAQAPTPSAPRSVVSPIAPEPRTDPTPVSEQVAPVAVPHPTAKPMVAPEPEPPEAEEADEADESRAPELTADRRSTLVRVLRTDADASVRRTAAWALAGSAEVVAAEALGAALRGDASPEVREMAAWAMAGAHGDGGSAAFADALRRDASPEVRATAAWALGQRRLSDASALIVALADASPEVREAAIWGVGQQGLDKAPAAIVAALRDGDDRVRLVAAWALSQLGDPATVAPLRAAFKEENDGEVRQALFHALFLIGERSSEVSEWAIGSKDPELREMAVRMLSRHGGGPWPWPWPRPEPRPFP